MIKLINTLEDLNHDFTQFSYRSEDLQSEVNQIQILFSEALSTHRLRANRFNNDVDDHQLTVNLLLGENYEYKASYQHVKGHVDDVLKSSNENLENIGKMLNQWQNNKIKAKHELDVKTKNYNQAVDEYSCAIEQRKVAEARYNKAVNDRNYERHINVATDQYGYTRHRNPSRLAWLEGAVNAASIDVGRSRSLENEALNKQNICARQLEAAQKWFDTCQYNVKVAEQSYHEAKQAVVYAENANDHSIEAESIMIDIENHMNKKVQASLKNQQDRAEEVNDLILRSDKKNDLGMEEKQKIDNLINEYVELVALAGNKLDDRIDLLEQFDRIGSII